MKPFIGMPKVEKNDERYTTEATVALMYKLLQPKPGSTLICPFDTPVSHFVKYGQAQNYNILHNMTDWLTKNYEYDYLITNPPFSIKDQVIEKCLQSGKPSALVLPIDALGGKRRHELYKKYGYPSVYIPSKRINYISENDEHTKSNYFHSVILIFNDLNGTRLLWE
jgi:hypothetical protein